jgi:hypothetical protein
MKKITFIAFLVFSMSHSFAQEKFIQLTKDETGKVKLFKENKRVKVKTLDGKKFIGKFSIVNESTISIKGNEIKIENIERIKSRSVGAGIVGTVLTVTGYVGLGVSAIIVIVDPSNALKAAVISLAVGGSGIFINEFVATHKSSKWSYKIIEK